MRRVRLALLKGKDRFGFRLTQFSVQSNHVHLIVEAENKAALTRGMKGLCVRLARAINRVMGRRGTVFSDRYHAHILRTPTEVRNAIRYVRDNSKIHAKRAGRKWNHSVDPFAGGPCERTFFEENRRLVVAPRFWLLRKAWAPP